MKLKEWQKILLIIVASFVVVGVFYLSMLSTVTEGAPPVARNSFLELTIAGEIPERTIDDPLRKAVGDIPNLSVKKILQTLHKAKIDDKIVGIILRPLAVGTGWAKTEEIRNALLDFKSTGKPIYAYLEMATKKEYYLASVADSIMGISTGILLINGFLSEPIFLKETLSKIGVEADFIAHGKYKNAPDMFTREDISDAQREVTNSILDQFYGNYVSSLASARSLDEARIREIIDQSFYSLEAARQLNLLDSLMYYHDFKEYIKKKR
ncbi:MAG: hypothetical protein GWN16_14950, partial [Calditrichae bacterium]|nr:hypothetical protein [Calditrichia bacterium]